ncbi:MAG: hypothetical protein HXS52_06045 [Theionarchaea archaeon]|nr:hypothetical protein [Theionarchaea archaeon]
MIDIDLRITNPYKNASREWGMALIFGMSPGVLAAWIVGLITVVLALLYPLMTKDEEGE